MIMMTKIVQIIGSNNRNKEDMQKLAAYLGVEGYVVLLPTFTSDIANFGASNNSKAKMLLAALEKVQMADVIICMNKDHYIGEDTTLEIVFADKCGKDVIYWYYENTDEIDFRQRFAQIIDKIENG